MIDMVKRHEIQVLRRADRQLARDDCRSVAVPVIEDLERGRILRLDGPSVRTLHVNLDEAMKEESDQQTDLVRISGKIRSEFPEPTTLAFNVSSGGGVFRVFISNACSTYTASSNEEEHAVRELRLNPDLSDARAYGCHWAQSSGSGPRILSKSKGKRRAPVPVN